MTKPDEVNFEDELVAALLPSEPEADSEQVAEVAPEGTTETPAVEEQPAEETPEAVPDEKAEAEAPEGTTDAEAEPEAEVAADEDDLSDLVDAEGNLDVDKVKKAKKSLREAQKLVGKTAKDREEIKKAQAAIAQAEQTLATAKQWDDFLTRNKDVAELVARKRRVELGLEQAPKQEEAPAAKVSREELDKKVRSMIASGDILSALDLAAEHNPKVQAALKAREDFEREKEATRRASEEAVAAAEAKREWADFQKQYAGSVFDADGKPKDAELHDRLMEVQKSYRFALPWDDALALAERKLGRVAKPPVAAKKPAVLAKQQAARVPTGAKPPVKIQPSTVIDGLTDDDLINELGLTVSTN